MSSHKGEVPTLEIAGAHPRLYNHDLAPTAPAGRTWGVFSLFAMWMSDVHSVGGYTFAASLFFLGLTGWQVLVSMAAGITAVYFLMNLIGTPSQKYGVPYPVIALVGYTNAGKSTLFNRLTDATVVAKDLLFATLDPTMRRIRLPSGRQAILSDTVGFISDLPTHLVAAFRATLEEVTEADLVVHVRDVHHPESEAQRRDVHTVLGELGLGEAVENGMVEVLNKIDLLSEAERSALLNQARRNDDAVPLSAVTGEGCAALIAVFDRRFDADRAAVELDVPLSDGAAIAWLYRHGEVLTRRDDDTRAHFAIRLSPADIGRFKHRATLH